MGVDVKSFFTSSIHRDHRGTLVWSVFTKWSGGSHRNSRWEFRRASDDYAPVACGIWSRLGESFRIISSLAELEAVAETGGNVLLQPAFAHASVPLLLASHECVKDVTTSNVGSYIPTGRLSDGEALRRVPTRKLRMQVLKRDAFRCVICGRRPTDHVDVELHVHHVLPWRFYGPTAEWNLATLCGTCHTGLDPDYEPEVRELAGLPGTDHPYYRHPPTGRNTSDIMSLTDNFLFLSGEIESFV